MGFSLVLRPVLSPAQMAYSIGLGTRLGGV